MTHVLEKLVTDTTHTKVVCRRVSDLIELMFIS